MKQHKNHINTAKIINIKNKNLTPCYVSNTQSPPPISDLRGKAKPSLLFERLGGQKQECSIGKGTDMEKTCFLAPIRWQYIRKQLGACHLICILPSLLKADRLGIKHNPTEVMIHNPHSMHFRVLKMIQNILELLEVTKCCSPSSYKSKVFKVLKY